MKNKPKATELRKFPNCLTCHAPLIGLGRTCVGVCRDIYSAKSRRETELRRIEKNRQKREFAAKQMQERAKQKPVVAISAPQPSPQPIPAKLLPLTDLNARLCQMHLGSR